MDTKMMIAEMSDSELAKQLKSLNEDIGPVTPNTRPLYERRLMRHLRLEQASSCTIPYTPSNTDDTYVSQSTGNSEHKTGKCEELCPTNGSVGRLQHGVSSDGDAHDEATDSAVFFGVQLQADGSTSSGCHVFTNKDDAIKLIKERKGGRFKAFSTRSEAEEFSMNVCATNCLTHAADMNGRSEPARPVPSESSSFRSLKFQELLPFRQAVEAEDLDTISKLVWSNPRNLIGSGDNPTVLHEGCRYNALHMCATKNKPKSCKLILELVEDPRLAQLLYPDDTPETRESRIDFFLDLYLNTPDKHLGETPLHFACKFGFVEVVAVLISHPGTDKQLKNTNGLVPKDVVCNRVRNASSEVKQKILALFENQFYVRVIGSLDNSRPAKVAAPWTPNSKNMDDVVLCSPIKRNLLNSSLHGSPREFPVTVKACAGPMTSSQAQQLHRLWVSPGAVAKENRRRYAHIRRGDSTKGLERIGREISRKMKVPWCEYWEFLDAIVDITSPRGLQQFETYLQKRLREMIDQRAAERQRQELQNTSICQLMQLLNLSDSSPVHSGEPQDNGILPDVQDTVGLTWPPSLAKLLPHDGTAAEVADTQSDRLSACSSDSFHTANDDSDFEYDVVADWPGGFDWQAVEPIFIYGEQPCKTDADVMRALETVDIPPISYPLVHQWRNHVLSHPEDVRSGWVPEDRLKRGCSHSQPMCSSTPTHDDSFNDVSISSLSLSDDSFSEHFVRENLLSCSDAKLLF